ncbi:MAG: excinuclease ABC subunit UvrC [Bryobacterales bacterium]|nr:excinuclease ABC subunit UvrC [Bryobacteraceae bacterium]MDW8130800.1 excinuclease ABC subunit UvrC [Bryobacterales bacterium]
MDLREKAAQLPALPGVYLYKDREGNVLYVGKAKNLRSRVRSYFSEDRLADVKTDTLLALAHEIEYILVDNEKEALALENNLIKQWKPRFNVLLRDDKTYPYIKLTAERWPRVYVTRRLVKDGSTYFGPYFPGNLAHRLVDFIHRHFKIPSCRIDLTRRHDRPCLQYHIGRCHGPCVQGLVEEAEYRRSVEDVRLFLEGRRRDLAAALRARIEQAAEAMEFERAAVLRDLLVTVEELEERQKMAAAEGEDTDVFGLYAEPPLVAVNVFHMRRGRVVDRREFFWEDQQEYSPAEFLSALLKQYYLDQQYVPARIHVPADFEDREALEELLSERRGRKVEIHTPQRGPKRALLELAETNARHSFEQRFRIVKPAAEAIQAALQDLLGLPEPPRRIECFDVSHIHGADTVASMVVWEQGRMQKSGYRKFIIRTAAPGDDFAAMREVVTRRYTRLRAEGRPLPSLVLVDGGVGQLHAAAEALESLGLAHLPLASIAKREEWIYVLGQEQEPIVLERHSPVLHLIQTIRDEAHRFAVTFHRARRQAHVGTELEAIPGIGPKIARKLLEHFGSVERLRRATEHEWAAVAGRAVARRLKQYYDRPQASPASEAFL